MKITKYPQSCIVVEQADRRILIDPGNFAVDAYDVDDFGALDAVLYTHRHADHCDPRVLDALRERGITLYGNADVCELLGEPAVTVTDGKAFMVGDVEVVPRDLPHVEMVDGSPGPPNTGFLVGATLFHPGDGIELGGLAVEALALPIAGPSISFRRAYRFVEETGAATVVPIHYDFFIADPALFAGYCDLAEVVVLGDGETASLG